MAEPHMFNRTQVDAIIAPLESHIKELESKLDSAHAAIEALQRSEQSSVAEIANLQSRLQALTTERDQALYGEQDLRNQLDATNERLTKIVTGLTDEIATRQSRLGGIAKALDNQTANPIAAIRAILVEKHAHIHSFGLDGWCECGANPVSPE